MNVLDMIIAGFVMLVPLIIIHEFGHFLACKSVGISVLEFGLGFPPRVLKLFRWGETDFTLNALPLGGFVMPYGEDMLKPQTESEMIAVREELAARMNITPEQAGRLKSVFQAKPWEKIWFLIAGPLANIVAAYVLFVVVAFTGDLAPIADVTVSQVWEDSPAASLLQEGDVIKSINGQPIDISLDLDQQLAGARDEITLTIERDGATQDLTLPLVEDAIPGEAENQVFIGEVSADRPAAIAGFLAGDQFLTIDGEPVINAEQLQRITDEHTGEAMNVEVLRAGEVVELKVTPEYNEEAGRGLIGILLLERPVYHQLGMVVQDRNFDTYTVRYGLLESMQRGWRNFWNVFEFMGSIPGQIIRGDISAEEARPVSVVGVAQIGAQVIEESPYQDVIVFTAAISILLAITNLLPIPGLDGGRILFVLIEIIRGKPLAPEREGVVHLIGLGLLMSLTVLLIINDIVNPIQVP